MVEFDDALLDDPDALRAADASLRHLAEAGGRVRIEFESASEALTQLTAERPRAVIVAGSEARLVRAWLEPVCPVPLMAWPSAGLPGWVGPLDLVIILAPDLTPIELVATAREAVRRGAQVFVACRDTSPLMDHAGSSATTFLTTKTEDHLAAALVVAEALHRIGLGPAVESEGVAHALDEVAQRCSPFRDLSDNPGKDFALAVAEGQVLLWGGSTLAARAARRVAEALRRTSGRAALAADAVALLPVLEAAEVRDRFADPFEDPAPARPVLVVFDDQVDEHAIRTARTELVATAERHDVAVVMVTAEAGTGLQRYAALRQEGFYGAHYLGVGLSGRS